MAFKILTLDGGGARGLYSLHILKRISEEFKANLSSNFDMIVGTSTGAIIAAALSIDYPIGDLTKLYERDGARIFQRQRFSFHGYHRSKYKKDNLLAMLDSILGQKTMTDSKTRLVIPATDISNGSVFVFKSPYLEDFVRDADILLRDAVMASCSAPTYFDPQVVREYLIADGGLWANNPTMVGLTEALGKLKESITEIKILSIGTGTGHKYYKPDGSTRKSWGLLTGWKGSTLIDMILNLQSASVENTVGLILDQKNYVRLTFSTDKDLRLDDLRLLREMKSKADHDFTYSAARIKKLLTS